MKIEFMLGKHKQKPGFFDVHGLFLDQALGQKIHFITMIQEKFFGSLIRLVHEIVYFLVNLTGRFFTVILFIK